MDFVDKPRRKAEESIVPMINVVFLLLIFFLMTAQITPPEPFEVTPPVASTETEPVSEDVIYVNAQGVISFNGTEGDAALAELTLWAKDVSKLQVRADAHLKAKEMARLMQQLAQTGLQQVELIVGAS